MRATMLWFNAAKDLGALRTDDGERIEVAGSAFARGEKPVGRCAGKTVEFDARDGVIAAIAFVQEPPRGRARLRRRS